MLIWAPFPLGIFQDKFSRAILLFDLLAELFKLLKQNKNVELVTCSVVKNTSDLIHHFRINVLIIGFGKKILI